MLSKISKLPVGNRPTMTCISVVRMVICVPFFAHVHATLNLAIFLRNDHEQWMRVTGNRTIKYLPP